MNLGWRDAAAAVPVAASIGLLLADPADTDLPLPSDPRAVAVVVLVLGVASCWVGGGIAPTQVPPPRGFWLRALGLHGAAAFLIAVLVLITGSSGVLTALVALVALMWLVTTVHRLFAPPDIPQIPGRTRLTGTKS